MVDVLDNKTAGFITAPEVNGLMPEVHGLSDQVEDSVGLIVESSGSTGVPKRIELSSTALLASAEASAKRIGSGQWLLALPVNFIGGANVLIRSVVADTQPVIMNTQLPFTAEAFVRGAALMTETRYTSLVPAQLAKLAQAAETDSFVFSELRKFEAILLGGQRPDWAVVESLRSKGVNIVISYGMTETAGGCVYDGVPLAGVELSFVDSRTLLSVYLY
jgi:O-succinylbenzoic acid--CoA ligase